MDSIEASEIGNPYPAINAAVDKIWKPNERGQQEVLSAPDSIFEILGGGAAGGGKTDLGILLPLVRGFHDHPKFKGLTLRRTFADIEKEIVPRQHEWYAPAGATYNETKKIWKWSHGSRIQNGHAEREDDVRKYDSAEYNYVDWDESTHFTEFQYLYLSISRCRSSSPDLPAIVRSFTNPGNVGHAFFKKRFVDPYPRGRKIIIDKVTGQKRMYIPFLGTDNPWLTKNDPEYLRRLEALPESERLAKLYGNWDAYEGQVFSEFRVRHVPTEPENAVHVIDPFLIPEWWPRFVAIDWGYDANTFAIWAAVSPKGRVYCYRIYVVRKTYITTWAAEIANITGNEILENITVCHSAGANRGEPHTIRDQIYEAFDGKYDVNLGAKDRIGGKVLLHEYLRWRPKPKRLTPDMVYDHELATKILRIQGERKYNDYLALFIDEPEEDNLPKLQILSHSPEGRKLDELIDVIPACVPAKNNPEDVQEWDGDDGYDCIRMIIRAADTFIQQSKDMSDKVATKQRIIDAFAATQNQTTLQRELEKFEHDTSLAYGVRSHRRVGIRRGR